MTRFCQATLGGLKGETVETERTVRNCHISLDMSYIKIVAVDMVEVIGSFHNLKAHLENLLIN